MTVNEHSKVLAERYGLSITARPVRKNDNMRDMPAGSKHFTVTLRKGNAHFSLPFSQGPRCEESPTLYDVLACLASDASMIDSGELDSFDQYADAFGVDSDSRTAERDYKRMVAAINKNTEGLKTLLGDKDFACLLQDEDAR